MRYYKQSLIFTLLLLPMIVYADIFPESFENKSLAELGWVTYAQGAGGAKWETCSYASQTTQFPNNLQAPPGWGEWGLHGTTKGAGFVSEAPSPDIVAATPSFIVGENSCLSFLMACNMMNNGGANVAADAKTRFEVVVSPTGDSSKSSFTDILYSELPVNLNKWKAINVDLTPYKGTTIRVAFRMIADQPAYKNGMPNELYIDGVQLTASQTKDVALLEVCGIFNGCRKSQNVGVKIKNNGPTLTKLPLQVKVNNVEKLLVTASVNIPTGETADYYFDSPIEFETGQNEVVVTAMLDGDAYEDNNYTLKTVNILPTSQLPFTLLPGEAGETQLISTASGSIKEPDGWRFFKTLTAWVHTVNKADAYLYTPEAYALKSGALRLDYTMELTGEKATIAAYITKNIDDFGSPAATMVMTNSTQTGYMIVPVEEAGDYVIALRVLDGAYRDQIVMYSYSIEQAVDYPDVEVSDILIQPSVLTGKNIPVRVKVSNVGAAVASDIHLKWKCGDTEHEEMINNIPSGESVEYTFADQYTVKLGNQVIKVSVVCDNDQNHENDSKSKKLTGYDAYSIPFRDSFEDEAQSNAWTCVNLNGKSDSWYVDNQYEFDGSHLLALSQSTFAHNDFAISPAISLQSGWKGRLSFYYGAGGNIGSSVINAYLTKYDNPQDIINIAIPIEIIPLNGSNVEYNSNKIEISEDGVYYIAFWAKDGNESLLIDDVRLDSTEEVSINGVTFSHQGADYDLQPAQIHISGKNHGFNAVNNLKFVYTVYLYANDENSIVESGEELFNESIPAGEIFNYTLNHNIEFNQTGCYSAAVKLLCSEDSDDKNNVFFAEGPEKLITMQVPAKWDMERSDILHGFELDSSQTWKIGAVNPYDGSAALVHTGGVRNPDGDSMMLNRVFIPKGVYDISFFWHTTQNQTGELYNHTFKVILKNLKSNTTSVLFSFDNTAAPEKLHRKAFKQIQIPDSEYYQVQIVCYNAGLLGNLSIDNFEIKPREADVCLVNSESEYMSDFADRGEEWQHYHPLRIVAQQWLPTEDNDGYVALVLTEFNDPLVSAYTGSWLQAPSFEVAENLNYQITADLEIRDLDSEHLLTGNEYVELLTSDCDNPSMFVPLGRFTNESKQLHYTSPKSGILYLTLKAHSVDNAVYVLKSFSVKAGETGSVSNVSKESSIKVNGRVLQLSSGGVCQVYGVDGSYLGHYSDGETLPTGLLMIKYNSSIFKMIVK